MRPPPLSVLLLVIACGSSLPAGAAAQVNAPDAAPDAAAEPTSAATVCGIVPVAAAPTPPSTQGLGDPSSAANVVYVSPQGDDRWSGRKRLPTDDGADGPLKTIEAARDAVRAGGSPGRIILAGGDYFLAGPVTFDSRDAGLEIQGEAGSIPVLHGGLLLRDWRPEADGRWSAPLPAGADVAAVFIDDTPQPLARFPDKPSSSDPREGWLFADALPPGTDPWQANTQFRYRVGDVPELETIDGLVATIMGGFEPGSQWGNDTLPVTAIDRSARTIHTKGTAYFFTAEGSRYYLSGLQAFQDAPGEWWPDRLEGRIWLVPTDRPPDKARIVAGLLPTLIHIDGAEGMVISGLALRHGSPIGTGKFGTDTRGGGAIRIERSDHVRLLDNIIENVGVGIHVSESRDVVIAGNEIGPVAGNGIYVGTAYGSFGRSDGARIVSNHLHDIGEVYFESAGIVFQAADDVSIEDNLIENAAQFGILGGSIWGPQDAVHRAMITGNEVRNANRMTADGGAIKMMGMQADLQQSAIRSNRIIGTRQLMNRPDGSFWPTDYENVEEWPTPISWAIYTDGKASGIAIENNTLIDNVSAIGINGGWNNTVTGNVVSGGSGAAFRVDDGTGRGWKPDWAKPNRIEGNTVSLDGKTTLVASVYQPGNGPGYVSFADNRYCGGLGPRSFDLRPEVMRSRRYGSLQDLQATGMDVGSVGPAERRFRLFGGPR
ncbi:MAG: right-handed parallel beta-helix repeat-containing protein [Bosea sp.]|nr:right-handed parallel beta-helix repeat-containing protein [Bosea sp. (in: a-proteobacteria)]